METLKDRWQSITDYIDSRPTEQKKGARLMFERLKPEMERMEKQIAVMEGRIGKEPFPTLEDINVIKGPGWLRCALAFIEDDIITRYGIAKEAYENGVNVTWEPKDKHAEIKAQYAEVKETEKNGGPIVKAYHSYNHGVSFKEFNPNRLGFSEKLEYKLRFYEIDWNKVLETSYRDGEFVECEFSDNNDAWDNWQSILIGIDCNDFFLSRNGKPWKYCRLPKGTEIKDEWLREVEK